VKSGKFVQYDYGSKAKNKKHYGYSSPPKIDVAKVTKVPVALFRGSSDELADTKDT